MAESNTRSSAGVQDMEREFVITRVFDAPRELVFKAWTEPKHMAQWWGPRVVENLVGEMDVRSGGPTASSCAAPKASSTP